MKSGTKRYSGDLAVRRAVFLEALERRWLLDGTGGLIFVTNEFGAGGIGEYTTGGATVNAALASGVGSPTGIVASGADLFVVNSEAGTIGEYTTGGATVDAALVSGLSVGAGPHDQIAVSGSDLFVAFDNSGTIGEYTTSGATVNAALITGLNGLSGIAVSGSNLFVLDDFQGAVAEYTTSGATVNSSLITGLNFPSAIAVSGSNVFVATEGAGIVGEYTTAGATVNARLLTGLVSPDGIAVLGSDLFVTADANFDTIGEYTTSGATVNASLVPDAAFSTGICVVPVGAAAQLAFGSVPSEATAGNALSPAITVEVEDANGIVVPGDSSNVTLSLGDGSGSGALEGTITVAAVNGVATFSNVAVSAAGDYTLTAQDGVLAPATSAQFQVIGPAAQLAFDSEPGDATAGGSLGFVSVDVEDAQGNIVPGDTSLVTLSITGGPAGATLGGTVTVAAVDGVATFGDLSLSTAGTYTLTANDAGLPAAISDPFQVTSPLSYTVSESWSVTVINQGDGGDGQKPVPTFTVKGVAKGTIQVIDGVFNLINTTGVDVGSPTGMLEFDGATYSVNSAAVVHGTVGGKSAVVQLGFCVVLVPLHTDNASIALTYDDAYAGGGSSLSDIEGSGAAGDGMEAGDLTYDVSSVSSLALVGGGGGGGGAAQLAFDQQPASATANGAISPAFTVEVDDANGALVTGDTSHVTLSIASGPAGGTLGGTTTVAVHGGVATFNNVSLSEAGTYTLVASDGALSAADPTSIAVTAAAAAEVIPTLGAVSLPASVVAGAKISAKVPVVVTDSGGTVTGNVTVNVYADEGTTLDGNQMRVASLTERVSLGAGKTHPFNFTIGSLPPALPAGTYHLVVEAVSPSGATHVTATSQTITVAAGFYNLMGALVSASIPAEVMSGQLLNGTVNVAVTESGNLALPKGEKVAVAIIAHNTEIGLDTTLTTSPGMSVSQLKSGAPKNVAVRVKNAAGLAAGSYDYYAEISPVEAIAESSVSDNLVTTTANGAALALAVIDPDIGGFLGTSTVPTVVTAGAGTYRGVLGVTVANAGAIALSKGEQVTIAVIAHPTGGGSDVTLTATGTKYSVSSLGIGRTTTANVKVAFEGTLLAAGIYALEARIVPVQALTETNVDNDLATATAAGGMIGLTAT